MLTPSLVGRATLGGSLTALFLGSMGLAQAAGGLPVEEIVSRMLQSEREQEKNLQYYHMLREYRLHNKDRSKDVSVVASVGYNAAGVKKIDIVRETGSEGIFRRVIRKVLETEVRASSEEGQRELRLSPENYDFKLLGMENRDGNACYVLQLLPKRKNKYLLDGKAWVDAREFAIVGVEGRPSASISFWVGKPLISQSFEKVGNVWLMSRNQSLTNAKLIGLVTFIMETREVQTPGTKIALRRHAEDTRKPLLD